MSQTTMTARDYQRSMTEAELLAAVTHLARLLNYKAFHPWLSVKSEAGYPDLTLLRCRLGEPPRLIFAELKSATGRLTPHQRDWLGWLGVLADYLLATLGEPAVSVYLWTPTDWVDGTIEAVLRG